VTSREYALCPSCGYPDTKDGKHYKRIYTPGKECPQCKLTVQPPTQKPLEPPDPKQCQAEISNGVTFMTMGGRHEMVRCKEKPIVIIEELHPGKDGLHGSMALCASCWKVAIKQLGWYTFSARPI
jgi:hypothetical protein